MITLALGLPHTPWIPERVESFARLREQLGDLDAAPQHVRIFDERASNKVWPRKMWQWMLDTGASHCLTLQDDCIVSPDFWPALRAMIECAPARILGLSAAHPLGPEMARQGRRWYRTQSWIIGWAYCLPRDVLARFVEWLDANPETVAVLNEDQLLNEWITRTDQDTWHPVPSIVDHDTSIGSTYANDAHVHRRTTVTWRGYQPEDLVSVDWWRTGDCPRLPLADVARCWGCLKDQMAVKTQLTGAGLCRVCVVQFVAHLLGVQLGIAPQPGA